MESNIVLEPGCRWVANSFCCAKKTRRKKEAVKVMYTVLFKETGYKIYIQWVPPLVIFLSLITVKLICSFLISILIPIQLLAKGFITRRFHRDLGLKM